MLFIYLQVLVAPDISFLMDFLMVQKVSEINLFFTTFVNKTTMDLFGLFYQLFEPLEIHQTISNSNQTIHKTLY